MASLYGTDAVDNIITLLPTNDADQIYGGGGDDNVLKGAGGNDSVYGGEGNDTMEGNDGDDLLEGGAGNDLMWGNEGNDELYGGSGDDGVRGGTGVDKMWGGSGRDAFDFFTTTDSGKGPLRDIIYDFSQDDHDVIRLVDIDAKASKAGDQAFKFIGDNAFTGKQGQVRFDNHKVFVDVDGNGKADFQIKVIGVDTMVKSDFDL